MNAYRGYSVLLILAVIVVFGGGATYAVVQRSVLKTYFETGDKPTEEQKITETEVGDKPSENQFADTIDSDFNLSISATDNKKIYTAAEAEGAMTLRWTALVPKPQESTYRIKVWQLMQGQNSTQAMKSNDPVVTKEVTSGTEVSVAGLYTGPCKPPYLCEFVWTVQTIDASGKVTGTSEPTTFSVSAAASSAVEGAIKQETDGSAGTSGAR